MNSQEKIVIVHRHERTPKKLKALMLLAAVSFLLSFPAAFFGFGGAGITDIPLWQHLLFVLLKWLSVLMLLYGFVGGIALRFIIWWHHS